MRHNETPLLTRLSRRLRPALERWVTLNAMQRDADTRLSRHTGARC